MGTKGLFSTPHLFLHCNGILVIKAQKNEYLQVLGLIFRRHKCATRSHSVDILCLAVQMNVSMDT